MSARECRGSGFPLEPQLLLCLLTAARPVSSGGLDLFPFPTPSVSRLDGTSAEITLEWDWDLSFAQTFSMSSAELN